MQISELDYNLPKELIAFYPPKVRGTSNLMVIDRKSKSIDHKRYSDLPDYLYSHDVIVLNKTKVMNSRLYFVASSGRRHELLFLESLKASDCYRVPEGHDIWKVLISRSRKLSEGDLLLLENDKQVELRVKRRLEPEMWEVVANTGMMDIFDIYGHVPLPSYIKREDVESDKERYNTVFGTVQGSVAAPTASLNLTEEIFTRIRQKGVNIAKVTLNIGWGTFSPIRVERIEDHPIHEEWISIDQQNADIVNNCREEGGKVIAIGTTAARTLETVAALWGKDKLRPYEGKTDLYIYPGYDWKVVDSLLTNFHAPRTTLLSMISSCMGHELMMRVYDEAIEKGYRFLSYGDSSLII